MENFYAEREYPMQFTQYTCVHECYNAAYATLMRREVQNLLPLGNLILGHQGKDNTAWRNPANWFMATVSDESGILLTAVMTPPMPLTLYATDNKLDANAINCLLDGIADLHLPGIVTEKALAECFAKAYTTRAGMAFEVKTNQRIYELAEVNPAIPRIGTIRLIEERDMPFLPFWLEAMHVIFEQGQNADTMQIPTNIEYYQHQISTKKLYVLEVDGVAVSMAGLAREMDTVVGVGRVYTPLYLRFVACKFYRISPNISNATITKHATPIKKLRAKSALLFFVVACTGIEGYITGAICLFTRRKLYSVTIFSASETKSVGIFSVSADAFTIKIACSHHFEASPLTKITRSVLPIMDTLLIPSRKSSPQKQETIPSYLWYNSKKATLSLP